MKKIIIGAFLGIVIGYLLALYFPFLSNGITENKTSLSTSSYHTTKSSEPYGTQAQCTFNLHGTVAYEDGFLSVESGKQNVPMILTFTGLDTEKPTMIGNMGDEVVLTKIDLGDTLYLIEQTGAGYIVMYTLFRDDNIALISKQYDLLGTPFGQTLIGDCVSGLRL